MSGDLSGTTKPPSPSDSLTAASPRRARKGGIATWLAIVIALVLLAAGFAGGYLLAPSSNSKVTISETGSSLIYPYLQILAPHFNGYLPGVTLSPASTGSGTGISSAEAHTIDLGGTDAYLTPATAASDDLINFPIAISAQLAVYYIPGVTTHLNLNGTVLAMIYQGVITTWNDPLIEAANPGVSLPSNTIVPIHRSDGSGDTFLWTSLCYMSWSGWTGSYGTTITWPAGSVGATGNPGMVTTLSSTPYGIAYIGISYLSEVQADSSLAYAALGDNNANYNGTVNGTTHAGQANYILPTATTISQDADLALVNLEPPSVAISLILGGVPGATDLTLGGGGTNATVQDPTPYPDVNLEYLLVSSAPSDATHAHYVLEFLEWSLSVSATYASQANFLPLTPALVGYDMAALAAVP